MNNELLNAIINKLSSVKWGDRRFSAADLSDLVREFNPITTAAGAYRVVAVFDDFVVKAVRGYDSEEDYSTKSEVLFWKRVSSTPLAQYFAEVYWHSDDYRFSIMRRCRSWKDAVNGTDDGWYYSDKMSNWTDWLVNTVDKELGIHISDLHSGNVSEDLVVFDYGFAKADDTRYFLTKFTNNAQPTRPDAHIGMVLNNRWAW